MRKTPIEHDVSSYTRRDGKRISTYVRGTGKRAAPRRSKLNLKRQSTGNVKSSTNNTFNTSLILSKGSESYLVHGESFSDASRNGLRNLKAAEVPIRVRVRIT